MGNGRKTLFAAAALSAAFLAGTALVRGQDPGALSGRSTAHELQDHFVSVGETVGPAVVSISTEVTGRLQQRRLRRSPSFPDFEDDLFDRFFQDFFGDMPQQRQFKQRGLGTGVIIDEEGYILTNEHVIHGADKVTVTLPDGRELKGEIRGTDPRSDLAVVKVDAKNLPAAPLGDSDKVKIGQWAIAIGNPFGFAVGGSEATLTVGVVSAVNRTLRLGGAERDYSSLLQTDAAINPGNSGGPLVNVEGQVIGINVAIFSTTGGYQGIGFAIPINNVKAILGDLIQGKKILYGWLGANVQDVNEELAKYFGLDSREGVIVAKVLPDSPGEKAGLREGDVIRTFDGKPVKDVRELLKHVSRASVGKKVQLGIMRDKKMSTLSVEIGQRPGEGEEAEARGETAWRGIAVGAITPDIAAQLQLEDAEGVVIVQVEPSSIADAAGLRPGDVIRQVNRTPVKSVADFGKATRGVKGDVLLKTSRGFVVLPEAAE